MEQELHDLVSKKKAVSPVWIYFGFKPSTDSSPVNETAPICRLCGAKVAAKAGNTSNLFSHLKHKHPQQYTELKATGTATSTKSQPTQTSIKQSLEAGQPYSRNSKRWQQLTDSITYAVAKDSLPFTTVEKPGFQKMLSAFDHRYKPPSRKYFSKVGIPRLYNCTREKVEIELKQDIKFFSATTDLWSSENLHPYMSYTIHYINDSWEMRNLCLQTAFLPADHTGENLAEALETCLGSWGLKKEKQVCLTTDSGSNIVCATSKLGWQRLSCFGHNLNLAVTKALKDDNRISRALGLARKIVSAFSNSWKRRRELKNVQAAKDLPEHNLIHDCPTRWGAMEAMVARLLEQEEAVRVVLSSDRKITHLIPTWQDLQVLESISKALSPVSELTDFLSGENHITVSSIIPILHNLKTKVLLPSEDDTTLTKDIKKAIVNDLQARYTDASVLCLLSTATFLDPRFKLEYSNCADKNSVKKSIEEQAKEFIDVINPTQTTPAQSAAPPPSKKKKMCIFLKKSQEEQSSSLSPEERISKEIESYLSCPILDVESNVSPLKWWKDHATSYPTLSKLAVKILCVCATSCASERLFSTSGHIVTPARASLNPEKVNMLVFLAKNLD